MGGWGEGTRTIPSPEGRLVTAAMSTIRGQAIRDLTQTRFLTNKTACPGPRTLNGQELSPGAARDHVQELRCKGATVCEDLLGGAGQQTRPLLE